MTAEQKPKAYSYIRFSTPEQERGDSFRRQTEAAARYAREHGLELVDDLELADRGVSAYRGDNQSTGRLGFFLDLVRDGHVPKGSYLLMESLDRLSRQNPRRAARCLEDIAEAGVVVVTLFDGRTYTKESLDDPFNFIMAVLFMARAHEESETKARRLREAWKAKRKVAQEGKRLTTVAPGWLKATADGGFEAIPERAETVRLIYRLAIEGKGRRSIAGHLNTLGVPTFGVLEGRWRRDAAPHWYDSYVIKILTNPAVIGTLVPHVVETDDTGRSKRRPLDPIPNYYPAVVDLDTWEAVQRMARARAPSGGPAAKTPRRNPLGGLLRCSCGVHSVIRDNKGAGWVYYSCSGAKRGVGCKYKGVPARLVDETFLADLPGILLDCPQGSARASELEDERDAVDAALDAVETNLEVALEGGSRLTPALRAKVDQWDAEREELRARLAEIEQALAEIGPGMVQRRAHQFAEQLQKTEAMTIEQINAACRSLFKEAVLDAQRMTLTLRWSHGGEHVMTLDPFHDTND